MILSTHFQMNELFPKYTRFSKPLSLRLNFSLLPTWLNPYIHSDFVNNLIHPNWKSYAVSWSSYCQANFMPSLLWSLFCFTPQKPPSTLHHAIRKHLKTPNARTAPKFFFPYVKNYLFLPKSSELNSNNFKNMSWLRWKVFLWELRVCVVGGIKRRRIIES